MSSDFIIDMSRQHRMSRCSSISSDLHKESSTAAQTGTRNAYKQLHVSTADQKAATEALAENTTFGSQFKEQFSFSGGKGKVAVKWIATVVALLATGIFPGLAVIAKRARNSQNDSNRAKELLRNPVDLRSTVKELANRGLTSFEEVVVNENSIDWDQIPQHLTAHFPRKEREEIDTAVTKQHAKGQEWMEALKTVGKGMNDDTYRALVAVATDKAAVGLNRGSETNYTVEAGVSAWHQTQAEFVGNALISKVAAANTPEDVERILEQVQFKGQEVAGITGSDVRTESRAIFTALHNHSGLQKALQAREGRAVSTIQSLRNLEKLKQNFLQENLERLSRLAGQEKGEEWLKLLMMAATDPAQKRALETVISRVTGGRYEYDEEGVKHAIHEDMQKAHIFLTNLENDFSRYVEENEGKAQEQLELISMLRDLGDNDVRHSSRSEVDCELCEAGKIPRRIDPSSEAVEAIDNSTLVHIAQILMGDGTPENPGSPTLFRHYLGELQKKSRLDDAIGGNYNGVFDKESHGSVRDHFFMFAREVDSTDEAEAVKVLRAHLAQRRETLTAEKHEREVRQADLRRQLEELKSESLGRQQGSSMLRSTSDLYRRQPLSSVDLEKKLL